MRCPAWLPHCFSRCLMGDSRARGSLIAAVRFSMTNLPTASNLRLTILATSSGFSIKSRSPGSKRIVKLLIQQGCRQAG